MTTRVFQRIPFRPVYYIYKKECGFSNITECNGLVTVYTLLLVELAFVRKDGILDPVNWTRKQYLDT